MLDFKAERTFFAPGRVNLIGEHIDYNGGLVFPCALSIGTKLEYSARDDREIHLYSKNFPQQGVVILNLDDLKYDEKDDWANYPKGVFVQLKEYITHGFNGVYEGNIPNGAGLSSSASIELVTAVMVNEVFNAHQEMLQLIEIGQKVENQFIGVNSGIMDQFAVGMGRSNQAILLNTNTLEFDMVPLDLKDNQLVIMNTNKRRGLNDSKYNQRRSECEAGLALINQQKSVNNLCDLSVADLDWIKETVQDDLLYRRIRHCITENQRTKDSMRVLNQGDLAAFGKLMSQSHDSLRDDYEVTGIELDTLVAAALSLPDTLGARVTGAGFGGCAIAIVKKTSLETFKEMVRKIYLEKIGYEPSFYTPEIGDGARELK